VSLRDELLAAIDAGDHQAVHRRGWSDVWEHLATAYAPRQTCGLNDLTPYIKLLGNEEPADVLEALEACAGKWRPAPGGSAGLLQRQARRECARRCRRGRDRSSSLEALAAVAQAVRRGEQPCTCGPPTMRRWQADAFFVLRCPEGHLEQGQIYAAEDAEADE